MTDARPLSLGPCEDTESKSHWTQGHALLIRSIFSIFEERGVKYVVIRNEEELPDANTAKDVDILIDPRRLRLARSLVLRSFKEFGIERLVEYHFGNVVCLYGIDHKKDFSIHIDLIAGYAPKGFSPLRFEEIYQNKSRVNGFYALNQQFGAVFLLIYKIFGYSEPTFKEKYIHEFLDAQKTVPKVVNRILCDLFGGGLADSIADAMKNGSASDLISLKERLNWKLKFRSFRLFPLSTLVRPLFTFLKRFFVLLKKIYLSNTSVALIDLSSGEIGGLKSELRSSFGKTFVRDGDEFVEFFEWGNVRHPRGNIAHHIFKLFSNIRYKINAARLDQVSIFLLNSGTYLREIKGGRSTISIQAPSYLFFPKYLICFERTRIGYFKKSWWPFRLQYVLIYFEHPQADLNTSQISYSVVKFLLEKMSKPIFGAQVIGNLGGNRADVVQIDPRDDCCREDKLMVDVISFEAEALGALFGGMAERRLRHAALKDFENLPYGVGGREIVMVVHPDDLHAARALVAKIAHAKGLQLANYFADDLLTQFALLRRYTDGRLQQIKICFITCSETYGIRMLSAENMPADLPLHKGVPVLADPMPLLDMWLFHLLICRPLSLKYNRELADIAQRECAALTAMLLRFLSDARVSELVVGLTAGEGSTLVLSRSERRQALVWLWTGQGISTLPSSLRFAGFLLRDWLRPDGVFLSVSGPDGSGKTTVIDMVISQLRTIYGDNIVHYAHVRPTILPRIAEVAKKAHAIEAVDQNYDRPHRAKPSGLVGSAARLGYYWLDYMGGYFCSIRPMLKRREVMLFDRYYYDMIADSFRSRISLPMPLLRFMGGILPLPEYAFFIHVDPKEIYRRKQELTMDQIVQLNERYGDLARRGWLIEINNNHAPEKAAAQIVDHIVADRHAKALERLR